MHDILKAQSRTDTLTGCLNKPGILERLHAEMSLARRTGRSFAVGIIDFDHLEEVNATYGAAAGDVALKELVTRICATIRVSDSVGRIGGDEFLLVWPGLSSEGARLAAERVRASVEEAPFIAGEHGVPMTATLGITVTWGMEEQDVVLARAAHALSAARSAGGNQAIVE
jgi:diguanylate cyclase (GGDEF)-like protein